jgi:hypothetical protein
VKLLLGLLKIILRATWIIIQKLFKRIYYRTIETYKQQQYSELFLIYGILMLLVFMFVKQYDGLLAVFRFPLLILFFIAGIVTIRGIATIKKENIIEYYHQMMMWFIYSILYILPITILIELPIISNLIIINFFAFIYFGSRKFLITRIKHYFSFAILFFFMPVISMILWAFLSTYLWELTDSQFYVSDKLLIWMVLFITIILINIVIYWAPEDVLDEAKIAVYLLLAFFSSLSYCFFMSDIISDIVIEKINKYPELSNITKSDISNFVDNIVKWFTLPYLIGSVFGCFTVELAQRKYKIKHQKFKDGLSNTGSVNNPF